MDNDIPPKDDEILAQIQEAGGVIDPRTLIDALTDLHDFTNVIEGIQRAIERGKITLDDEGMVVDMATMACAA